MAEKRDELEIEEPRLDFDVPKPITNLPDEIPNVLEPYIKSDTPAEESDEITLLLKDVTIYLAINDVPKAKEAYAKVHRLYHNFSQEQKDKYFKDVKTVYKQLKNYNSLGAKLKRMFAKKPKAEKKAKKEKKPNKNKDKKSSQPNPEEKT